MFKLRIGFFLHQHAQKLCIRSTASTIKTRNLSSSCSKTACKSLPAIHLRTSSSPILIPYRTFWETFPSVVRSFHAKDELDQDNYELVYRGRVFNYAFYGLLVSELAIITQTGYALNHVLNYFLADRIIPLITKIGSFSVSYDITSVFALAFFTIQNAFVFIAAQKALLRVYHKKDSDEYVFISLTINPFKTRKIICKPGAMKCLHNTNLTGFIYGNYQTEDQRYFIREEHFKTNYHYNRLVHEDN